MATHPVPAAPATDPVELAVQALCHFGTHDLTRGKAARLLSMWSGRWMLDDDQIGQVLARFPEWSR